MAEQTTAGKRAAHAALTCKLRHKQLRQGNSCVAGEVELENPSAEAAEIEIDMHPLQYLNLVVTDAGGTVVSSSHYGDIFSPLGEKHVFRLAPGARYTHNVFLLETVAKEKRIPGRYQVQAVYQSGGLTAGSAPLEIELT
jgi:hypothetical protein